MRVSLFLFSDVGAKALMARLIETFNSDRVCVCVGGGGGGGGGEGGYMYACA